jgi:2-haloacid dehalogenase
VERWATFDCYGTLIDWNGGIGRELERLFGAARGGELLHTYHELEPQIQREDPSRSYRDVMAVALARLGAPAGEQDALERSLPEWGPFPEVPAALEEARSRGWRLAVLSNTDPDLLEASLARIGVKFELTVAASEIGSYKPASTHWDEFFARSGADRAGHGPCRCQPLPRHRTGFGARTADDLDQPARRGGRAPARRRAPQLDRPCRKPRLARAGVNVRAVTPDDFPAIAAFLAEDETHFFGRPARVGVPDVTAWLTGPDLPHDSWLFEEGGGSSHSAGSRNTTTRASRSVSSIASGAAAGSGRRSSTAVRSGFGRWARRESTT